MAKRGPKTPEGKNRSRMNRGSHYMTSRLMLVLDEKQAELDKLRESWHAAYASRNDVERNAVERAANSEWLLRRKERQADHTTAKIFKECGDMDEWTDLQRGRYDRMQRYLTAARREAERDRRLVESQRREQRAQDLEVRREQAAAQAEELLQAEIGSSAKETQDLIKAHFESNEKLFSTLNQSIYVEVKDGETETSFVRSNADILSQYEISLETRPVVRTITFSDGTAPPEYAWLEPHLRQYEDFIKARIQMSYRTFREVAEREKNGHLRPWDDLDMTILYPDSEVYVILPNQNKKKEK